jgi:hypothetical protein
MDMGVIRAPVADRHPVEPCPQILLHLTGEISGEGPDVFHLGGVFRRDDETEVMSVLRTAIRESLTVCVITCCVEHPIQTAVLLDPFPLEITHMIGQ